MDKFEVNPVIGVIVGVIVLGLIVFFGFRAVQPAQPPAGSYTPGVPPWLDPKNPNHGHIQPPPGARTGAPNAAPGSAAPAASSPG